MRLTKLKKTAMVLAVAASAMVGLTANADDLTMYDATASSGNVPIFGRFSDKYLKCEYVMPASELAAMSGKSILAMTWYLQSSASAAWTGTFQVFMKEVEQSTISEYEGSTSATVVYEGVLDGTASLLHVTFSTPYDYNGGNLLIGVYQTVPGNFERATFYGQAVVGACIQGYDAGNIDGAYATQKDFIPKTTFTCGSPDQFLAGKVVAKISAIGKVAYTDECKNLIEKAREAYDELPDDQKAWVTNYASLTDAEVLYSQLSPSNFMIVDGVLTNYTGAGGSVVIPDSVTDIGDEVFRGRTDITSVTIPGSVTNIGDRAFAECTGITNITFQGDAPVLGEDAFDGVPQTCVVTVPNGATGWDSGISAGTWEGMEIKYDESTVYSVTFANDIDDADKWTISPDSDLYEGAYVTLSYGGTKKIESVTATNVATATAAEVKEGEGDSWTFTMPASDVEVCVTYYSAVDIGTVTAPAASDALVVAGSTNVLVVGGSSDAGTVMYKVTSENVQPTSTEGFSPTVPTADSLGTGTWHVWYYIEGDNAHNDSEICATAITVTVAGSEAVGDYVWVYTLDDDGNATVVSISPAPGGAVAIPSSLGGNTVTGIGDEAFSGCTNLTSVTVPGSVTNIGDKAFAECASLANITFQGDAPNVGGGAFDGIPQTCVVTVPNGSTGWDKGVWEIVKVQHAEVAAQFEVAEYSRPESNTVDVVVCGGNAFRPSSVKVYLTYNSAAVADIDLAKGAVDGVTPKGGLKFPLTLVWDTGDFEPKMISIPIKADRTVEDDERFLLQLADPVGIGVGDPAVCTVTITDRNSKSPKATVTPYKPKSGETVTTNEVYVAVSPKEGGFAAGSGSYSTGTKLTMVAEARPGWMFAGWRNLVSREIVSDKLRYQIVISTNASYCAEFQQQAYVRGLAEPADGGKVTGNGYCPEGKKVTLRAAASKNFKFLRWENESGGTVATTASLVIDRSANPAKDSATSTTLTYVTKDATFRAVFSGDPRVAVTAVAFTKDGGVVSSNDGKVTGAGHYAEGKKVTLKATANKDFAFNGWYDVASGDIISQDASLTFNMTAEDVDLYARFVTKDDDEKSISLAVDGVEMQRAEGGASYHVTNYCGVAVAWPIDASALSAPSVKATGLPSGVKLVQDKVTAMWALTGAPTAASKTDNAGNLKPSAVKLTVTTAGKSSQVYEFDWTILPLPAWAVGTFDGFVVGEIPVNEQSGTVSLTVASNGKISGKMLEDGLTWTLAAASFESEADGEFKATVVGKSGKSQFTNDVTVAAVAVDDVEIGVASKGPGGRMSPSWTAWQNLWKRSDTKTAMPVFKNIVKTLEFGEVGDENNVVKLTFKANGAVSFAGKLDGVSVNGSAQLVKTVDGWKATLYVPPKKDFGSWCKTIAVTLDVDGANSVTDVNVAKE